MFIASWMKVKDNPNAVEPVDEQLCRSLKKFNSAGRGSWTHVTDSEWNDWKWQMRNRVTTESEIRGVFPELTDSELKGIRTATQRFSMALTPYLTALVDGRNPSCPLRAQFIPREEESLVSPQESFDPCSEEPYTVAPGLVHRYPDRVLLLVQAHCPAYCRYCTRGRLVGQNRAYSVGSEQLDYIKEHTEVRDVLISGGDPFLLPTARLVSILEELRKIPHIEIIRIGTRVPITLPQRVDKKFAEALRPFSPLFINVQTNHPLELTLESRRALEYLADVGIPLGNQSVLLKGVNDNATVMTALVQKLLICKVRPYYLYQCDMLNGTSHLRVPVERGVQIIRSLRGHTTGFAVPEFVVDIPDGGGKTPLPPVYVVEEKEEHLLIRNFEGKMVFYPKQ
ncbi:MAG: KamA family radical SAM protein [Verrucomicrobiota bacterium]|jgi:lysine 2,3-aminomutase|nr:KamA family radical SAM protein [Verrucomicrobiota bacterium]